MSNKKLLEVKNLCKYFPTQSGLLHAVDNVTFDINKGETLGVVGESGCGKSTTGRCIVRLLEPTSGEVNYDGENILKYNKSQMRDARKKMQIIFQDPFASLDPRKTVAQTIEAPLIIHKIGKTALERQEIVIQTMQNVGLAERFYNSYPHELDGGRRQRVGIARALVLEPEFIVCDEPVSALDVSIQAQILNLLEEVQDKFGLTYMFITHDLSVVYYFSDSIIVMYLGQVVEQASAEELFALPKHPYTRALLSAIPSVDIDNRNEHIILKGEVSSPINPLDNCRFCKRCPYAMDICESQKPPLIDVGSGHKVACFLMQ